MSRICSIAPRMAAVLLLTVALMLVGFGHQPRFSNTAAFGQSSTLATPGVATLRLPDGSAPVLCLDGTGKRQGAATKPCDACRLTAASALPDAPVDFAPTLTALPADWTPDAPGFARPGDRLMARPRGPPLA